MIKYPLREFRGNRATKTIYCTPTMTLNLVRLYIKLYIISDIKRPIIRVDLSGNYCLVRNSLRLLHLDRCSTQYRKTRRDCSSPCHDFYENSRTSRDTWKRWRNSDTPRCMILERHWARLLTARICKKTGIRDSDPPRFNATVESCWASLLYIVMKKNNE